MSGEANWFSDKYVHVALDGLRDAAQAWHGFADDMTTVSTAANGLSLMTTAFAVIVDAPVGIVTAQALQTAYQNEFDKLTGLFQQAITEFDAMGRALKENAEWYEDVDANSAQDFDAISKGHWPH